MVWTAYMLVQIKKESKMWWGIKIGVVQSLTVKLLLTFLVLDSATLASVRSTSSNMIDWRRDPGTRVSVGPRHPGPATLSPSSPAKHPQTPKPLKTWAPDNYTNTNCVHSCLLLTRAQSSKVQLCVFFKPGVHEWLHSWRKTKQNKKTTVVPVFIFCNQHFTSICEISPHMESTWGSRVLDRGSSVLPARITLRGKGPG